MAWNDLPERKRLPHNVPDWVEDGAAFFVTINGNPSGTAQFCDGVESSAVAEALLAAARYYHDEGKWFVHLFLVMPDHLHAILSFPREVEMTELVRGWKRFQARTLEIEWQSDFFDHRLRDEASFGEKFEYVRMNPVRKGLCERPEDWPHWVGYQE